MSHKDHHVDMYGRALNIIFYLNVCKYAPHW